MTATNSKPEGVNIPRRYDIEGAPFSIGAQVKISKLIDIETFSYLGYDPEKLIGRVGIIKHYDYDCGCSQSFPGDPMIGVQFEDGQLHEFWKEELTRLTIQED